MMLSLKMALRSIGANKMRSALTMLGIIIGVMALVVLVSLVGGATSSVTDAVSGLGTSMLTVTVSDDKGQPIDLNTVNTWMDEEEGLGLIAPYLSESATTSAMTPMMMPSMVRAARILLAPMERRAIFRERIISAPP